MIDVLNSVKQAYDLSTTQIDKIIVDNKEYRISKVQYDDDCYEDGNIIGTAIAKSLEFEIENVVDLENKEIEYLTGIYVDNNIVWTNLGKFIIQDVEPNDTTNKNKIYALDYMFKSNIHYKTDLNYEDNNITLLAVVQEGCINSGIELATTEFPNNHFIVDSNQFDDDTLIRQVFQAAAQISGTVAKIKNDNKLYFINPNKINSVSKIFTLNNYKEAEIKRNTQPINIVSLGISDVEGENITLRDEESIKKYGENSLIINDNPFAYTQEKREQLITALFDAVKGFDYKSFSFSCQSLFYLETLDKIQFWDKKKNIYNSYIFRFNYRSPDGLESSIEAPSITKASIKYQNIPDALDKNKKTEYRVNKAEQKITQLTQETSEHEEKLVEHQQDIDSLKQTVSNTVNYKREIEGITELHITDAGQAEMLMFEVKGNKTYLSNLYPRANLYPRTKLLPNQKGA